MPRISAPAGLPDLLNRQLSLASRSQLLHLGMKDNSMQYRAWHLSPEDWDRTRRRHDLMAAAGITVLHFPRANSAASPPW